MAGFASLVSSGCLDAEVGAIASAGTPLSRSAICVAPRASGTAKIAAEMMNMTSGQLAGTLKLGPDVFRDDRKTFRKVAV